jgi:hypothetical protein
MAVLWFPERRARLEQPLLRHYLDELGQRGVAFAWEPLWNDYRLSVVRHLFTPVVLSGLLLPAIWWPHLDRICAAFDDLECAELL